MIAVVLNQHFYNKIYMFGLFKIYSLPFFKQSYVFLNIKFQLYILFLNKKSFLTNNFGNKISLVGNFKEIVLIYFNKLSLINHIF